MMIREAGCGNSAFSGGKKKVDWFVGVVMIRLFS